MNRSRERLIELLREDLLGPHHGETETLTSNPIDVYLTGAIYPNENEPDLSESDDKDMGDGEEAPDESVPMDSIRRPSSMGISFAITGAAPQICVQGSCAFYVPSQGPGERAWTRRPIVLTLEKPLLEGLKPYDGPEGLRWWIRGVRVGQAWNASVILGNSRKPHPGREAFSAATSFQSEFTVKVRGGQLKPRKPVRPPTDSDTASGNLLYRDAREWAVGHACGATWPNDGTSVTATWLPMQDVPSMDPEGDPVFSAVSEERTGSKGGAFEATRLSDETDGELLSHILNTVPAAYSMWLDEAKTRTTELVDAGMLDDVLSATATEHLKRAADINERIRDGIALIRADSTVRRAFQLSQRAMVEQRRWAEGPEKPLVWRPFQIAFILLTVAGLARETDEHGRPSADRVTMDLLWFPTGGGKTEAYLALTAFVLIYRRLRERQPDTGAGVAVLMRYTLRLLTIQQFERATRLILACEYLRRDLGATGDNSLGREPFAIGLWVGSGATPNRVLDARNPLEPQHAKNARQLVHCPVCNSDSLEWDPEPRTEHYLVRCGNSGCLTHSWKGLPVHTIDEDVYYYKPGLVIGTIDKFAQIVRRSETHSLFGSDHGRPPELIIQDELHLISGPLGTLAGLYEAAIDQLCTYQGVPPKIIGSTATIRRAKEQVWSLFLRNVEQFPPPVLDAGNSCFAKLDDKTPGRIYAGVSSAGRSPKFTLQAICASLIQAASEVPDADRDPWWTLVTYFNSLRELGGALVMMQDDVRDSLKTYSKEHGVAVREQPEDPMELTSRVSSEDIPKFLKRLAVAYPGQDVSVVLATNMLSVGVDVPRLGLMVVNGQPKSMSEYIQATSRVGRNQTPGLIVTSYNAGRARDRSHFEAFRTWHQTLYREVEATSVTPFAPRARDRALHAVLVAVARHRLTEMEDDPRLTGARRSSLQPFLDTFMQRVREIDPGERADTLTHLSRILDRWEQRGPIKYYWNDFRLKDSLLASAELVAAARQTEGTWNKGPLPTLNSLRDVEPQVAFKLEPPVSN